MTWVHSENGRLVVTITAAFSARSAMTWNKNSAPISARGTYPIFVERDQIVASPAGQRAAELQLMFGLDQFVDQPGGAGEAHSAFLPAGRHRQAGQ
jgi:hypothetical protein